MRKMRLFVMLMAIAAVSFTFTSCDDDPWDDDYWDDPYGWYDDYNHGGWGWNQDYWYEGSLTESMEGVSIIIGDSVPGAEPHQTVGCLVYA